MRFSITTLTLLVVSTALGVASAQDDLVVFGICTCFNPKYDASCCIPAKGYMMNDGNVCSTPDYKDSVVAFRKCCDRSGGKHKCKPGYHNPGYHWPPENTYGCKAY